GVVAVPGAPLAHWEKSTTLIPVPLRAEAGRSHWTADIPARAADAPRASATRIPFLIRLPPRFAAQLLSRRCAQGTRPRQRLTGSPRTHRGRDSRRPAARSASCFACQTPPEYALPAPGVRGPLVGAAAQVPVPERVCPRLPLTRSPL